MTAVLPIAEPVPAGPPRAEGAPRRWPGILAFALGLLTMAGLVTGIVLATSDLFLAATVAAWVAVGASIVGVLAAIIALVFRFGSGWAAAGLILCVIANPLVLTTALDLIGGLWA